MLLPSEFPATDALALAALFALAAIYVGLAIAKTRSGREIAKGAGPADLRTLWACEGVSVIGALWQIVRWVGILTGNRPIEEVLAFLK